mgnify:CR=1 FL=1
MFEIEPARLARRLHLPLLPAILLAMLLTALLGMLIERVAYRPLASASMTTRPNVSVRLGKTKTSALA